MASAENQWGVEVGGSYLLIDPDTNFAGLPDIITVSEVTEDGYVRCEGTRYLFSVKGFLDLYRRLAS